MTSEAVQAALQSGSTPGTRERNKAEDAIVAWRDEGKVEGNTEDLARLYLALKPLAAAENRKVTPNMMKSWYGEIKKEVAVMRWVFIQTKEKLPVFPPKLEKEWLLRPDEVADLPSHFDPEEVWIIDDGCPRPALGAGVLHVQVRVVKTQKAPAKGSPAPAIMGAVSPASEMPAAMASASSAPAGAPGAPPPGAGPAGQQAPKPAARRVLEKRESLTDEQAAEQLAQGIEEDCKNQRVSSKNKDLTSTVEVRFRMWLSHLKTLRAREQGKTVEEFVESLDQYNKEFPSFVVKCLLLTECWPQIEPVASQLKDLGAEFPSLLPRLGKAIVAMCEQGYDLNLATFEIDGLALSRMPTLVHSPFVESYTAAKQAHRVKMLTDENSGMTPAAKKDMVEEVLELSASLRPEHLRLLKFAQTFMALNGKALGFWLLEETGRFDLLGEWDADSEFMKVKPFADAKSKWRDAPAGEFMSAADVIIKHDLVESVKSPVAKAVIVDLVSLQAAENSCSPGSAWATFGRKLFEDVAASRLGLKRPGVELSTAADMPEGFPESCQAELRDVILGLAKKATPELRDYILGLAKNAAEAPAQVAKGPAKVKKELADGATALGQPGQAAQGPAEAGEVTTETAPAEPQGAPEAASEGDGSAEVAEAMALAAYESHKKLPLGTATLDQVASSSAGVATATGQPGQAATAAGGSDLAATPDAAPPPPQAAAAAAAQQATAPFKAGDKVRTIAIKEKEKWNDQQATALRMVGWEGKKYSVMMESGPQKGKKRDYESRFLKPWEASAEKTLVAPAGQSPAPSPADDEAARAAKKQRSMELTRRLFGKLPEVLSRVAARGNEVAVHAVCSSLDDQDVFVRLEALEVLPKLARSSDERVAAKVRLKLADRDRQVRDAAKAALGSLGGPDADGGEPERKTQPGSWSESGKEVCQDLKMAGAAAGGCEATWESLNQEVERLTAGRRRGVNFSEDFAVDRVRAALAKLHQQHCRQGEGGGALAGAAAARGEAGDPLALLPRRPSAGARGQVEDLVGLRIELAMEEQRSLMQRAKIDEARMQIARATEQRDCLKQELAVEEAGRRSASEVQASQWREAALRTHLCLASLRAKEQEISQLQATLSKPGGAAETGDRPTAFHSEAGPPRQPGHLACAAGASRTRQGGGTGGGADEARPHGLSCRILQECAGSCQAWLTRAQIDPGQYVVTAAACGDGVHAERG
ncbi:unnamed protein product [Prorocentrum cordatum]|uniref:Uncharacterized protein n=1 Tax=Prorocentrum cordatum TaxID=2364126 RepID=A0ABN9WSF9_9DINO|nr:unnamed protein product [Polarella glacialis]